MFSLIIENGKVIKNTLKKNDNFNYFLAGEIFEPEQYSEIDKLYGNINNYDVLQTLIGEFCFIIEDEKKVYIINDEVGTIKWYYYHNNNIFIVSNNFWEIVNIIEPTTDDIDKEAIYENLLLAKTFNGKTFIKNIKKVMPGNLLIFDKENNSLNITLYKDIRYEDNKSLNKEELFDNIDNLFNKIVNKIRKFNNNNPKIGITISGGLDSRFPLPFLNKKEVISTYLIGQKNNLLNPFDYDNAKKLADLYGFNFKMIDPFSIDIEEKILIDLLRNPTEDSDIIKSLNYDKNFKDDNFDVLITGAYGGLIGGRSLNDKLLNAKDNKRLAEKLFTTYSKYKEMMSFQNKEKSNVLRKINFITKNLFNIDFLKNTSKTINLDNFLNDDFLIKKEYKQKIFNHFDDYVKNEKKSNKNNLSIIMKYHLSRHSMYGSFESLQGQIKAYSIYHPYIYEYSKSWPSYYLKDRYIMEEYLFKKHPKLAEIPLQSYGLPISYRFSKISFFKKFVFKIKYIFLYFTKKLAINYTKWWNRDDLQDYIKKTFNNNYTYFYKLFSKKDVEHIMNKKDYTHFADDLFKTKLLIDLIESKKYKSLLKKDTFRKVDKF